MPSGSFQLVHPTIFGRRERDIIFWQTELEPDRGLASLGNGSSYSNLPAQLRFFSFFFFFKVAILYRNLAQIPSLFRGRELIIRG